MISLAGSSFGASLPASGCACDTLKKNTINMLKTATNNDLRLFDIIPESKFGAKIRRWG
jgi:hypothetical protein